MIRKVFWLFFALLSAFSTLTAQEAETQPELVIVAGTIQSVLGCEGDWQPECEATALSYDAEDDLWQGTFDLPAGDYEYKVALNGTWDENYGLNSEVNGANITLSLAEDTSVKFIYDHTSHYVADSVNRLIANVPGSYQSEIGCPDDWQPSCLRSLLQDPDGDGIYVFSTGVLPAGAYESKVAVNESWDLNYGVDGAAGGANIAFIVAEDNTEVVFQFDSATNIMTIIVGGEVGPAVGSLFESRAYWVSEDTLAWNIARIPGADYTLSYSADGALELSDDGLTGGNHIELTYERGGFDENVLEEYPFLSDYFVLKIDPADLALVPDILRGQIAISSTYGADSALADATGVQIAPVLDDLYAEAAANVPLGVTWADGIPTLSVWAPTALSVALNLYADSESEATSVTPMDYDAESGVWSITGGSDWAYQHYLYDVEVYVPSTQTVEHNLVTDPYSLSLSTNSTRSQIVDLDDPALMPENWLETAKPELDAPEDIVLYELHIRDFSIIDESVPESARGTYMAFTYPESAGMTHLTELAEAGLTHIHLLPAFDIATINENADERQEPDRAALEALPPDSEEQQALIEPLRDLDGFNWGYDPYHYTTPEGSYSTDPEGAARIREFRAMVQGLNNAGLRVVMDVVYNHTNASGQGDRSVLDRIVPGYYHRLSADGRVETSTCCQNTATEHAMMERLMIDSVVTWATDYRVDGFRFDLMGHHMRDNMVNLRETLDSLTLENSGVDGEAVYVYGEGWNFGEVADNARGVNATQLNMAGTGIGTFSDRLRDAVRGGNPFGGWQEQSFSNGLLTDPNEVEMRETDAQRELLLHFSDLIRVGLAGNLANYTFMDMTDATVTGADIDYNGQPAGYTLDPQENIVYVSAHDNETLFDAIT